MNDTHWTLTVLCKGCSEWVDVDGNVASFGSTNTTTFGMAQSNTPVLDPASNTSSFNRHNSDEKWDHDLSLARSPLFNSYVAGNVLPAQPIGIHELRRSSLAYQGTVRKATPRNSGFGRKSSRRQTGTNVPESCSGVPAAKFQTSVASGWKATKIAGGLQTPRGAIFDSAGHLLIVESGKGITVFTLDQSGCVSTKKTLISQTNLNHGIRLSPDGNTLYASSMTTVWKWSYNPTDATITGTATVLVTGMSNGGHATRTIAIPENNPNLLVVSCGSNANLDMPSGDAAIGRAIVKVFDLSSAPSGGYNYASGGYSAGYGLRNEVGIVFDGNNM